MPISATGIWKSNPRRNGFTLIEVMVTLVLIGIITTLAVLSVGGGGKQELLAEEARRLAALIELNRQEAVLRTEEHGVRFTERGYSFMVMDREGNWKAPEASPLLADYALPEGVGLALRVEDRPVDLEEPSDIPQVVLLSSGEVTDFTVTFSAEYVRGYVLYGDPTGNLDLKPAR